MAAPTVERYLRLGLRLDRHVEGVVDAYFGPAELASAVAAESPFPPADLVEAADELLYELTDGWLRDQLVGLRTYAGVIAGESRTFADEAEGCYGLRPAYTDEAVFEAAHQRLEELLPGGGSLAERYTAWESSMNVPAERSEQVVAAAIGEARDWTRRFVELPEGEGVSLELIRDEPWMAYCEYLGDFRSRISVNVDLPQSAIELLTLAIHETYPGHHAERACKERRLVRAGGLIEESIVLVPTPQSVISEGIAQLAPRLVLAGEAGPALAALVHDAAIELDLAHALEVREALRPCRWAEVNAALMLHEDGASEASVRAYLERWGLMTPELSAHMIRFMNDPTSRTYVFTYPAGQQVCESYVGDDVGRFRRLLTEQVRIGELLST